VASTTLIFTKLLAAR